MSSTTTLTDTIYSTIIVERAEPTTLMTSIIPSSSADIQLKAETAEHTTSTGTTHAISTTTKTSPTISAMASQIAKLEAEKKDWKHLHLALGLTIMALVLVIAFYVGLKAFCCYRRKKAKVVQGGVERVWPGSKKNGGKVGKLAGRVAGLI